MNLQTSGVGAFHPGAAPNQQFAAEDTGRGFDLCCYLNHPKSSSFQFRRRRRLGMAQLLLLASVALTHPSAALLDRGHGLRKARGARCSFPPPCITMAMGEDPFQQDDIGKFNGLRWNIPGMNRKPKANSKDGCNDQPENLVGNNETSQSSWGMVPGKQQVVMFLGEESTDFPGENAKGSHNQEEADDKWLEQVYSQGMERQLQKEVASALIQFYSAFTTKNGTAMEELWLKDETVQCTNPGQKPVVGYVAVMDVWRKMFSSKDPAFRRNRIVPDSPMIWATSNTAVTFCHEIVKLPRNIEGGGQERKMVALNIFQKRKNKWYLVHHQSNKFSVTPDQPPAPGSANQMPTFPTAINLNQLNNMNSNGGMQAFGLGRMGAPMNVDEIIDLMSRVIKDSDDASLEPTDEELSHLQPPPGFLPKDGSLHISPIGWVHVPNAGINRANQGRQTSEPGHGQMGKFVGSPGRSVERNTKDNAGESTTRNHGREVIKMDADRAKKAVSMLRKITAEGRISDKQKQGLLTELIRCTASEELSPVEVAYELLLAQGPHDGDGFEEALDDFADQCRVLSQRL